MKYAVLFPGQGSQAVGMCADARNERPDLVGPVAEGIVGWDINDLIDEGSEEDLTKTQHAQPALYAVSFAGGQVDITSGKFVFSANEAYRIEDGRIGRPVKGATLIGNGPEVMQRVSRIGGDLAFDLGVGTCGKDGQSVPVGVGMPTIRIDGLTVGGTEG